MDDALQTAFAAPELTRVAKRLDWIPVALVAEEREPEMPPRAAEWFAAMVGGVA